MSGRINAELERLNLELITLGALCEKAISLSATAIMSGDGDFAEGVRLTRDAIIEEKREIETICLKMLLGKQPDSQDLRTISAAQRMVIYMDRIGDQALNIAEIVAIGLTGDASEFGLGDMVSATIKMLSEGIGAFVRHDLELAHKVIVMDDEVDELFMAVRRELVGLITKNPDEGERAFDLLMIAKYLERIGDHVVNVAEWVEFSVTGAHRDGLNV